MKKAISIFNGYKPEVITPYQFKQNPVKYKQNSLTKFWNGQISRVTERKAKNGYVNIWTGTESES